MLLTTVLAEGLEHSEPATNPWVFGVVTFVILLALIIAVLVFGKGRPHA